MTIAGSTGGSKRTVSLRIVGMTCGACAASVQAAICCIDPAATVDVNVLLNAATITGASIDDPGQYSKAVEQAGFQCRIDDSEGAGDTDSLEREADEELRVWLRRFIVCILFAVPELLLCMVIMPYALVPMRLAMTAEVFLVSIVQWTVGLHFAQGALKGLRAGALTMDALVALASFVCYGATFLTGFAWDYLECASTLLLFVSGGKWLENVARRRTRDHLCRLGRGLRQQAQATLVEKDGSEGMRTIAISVIALGDTVLVRPGESIPVDGIVAKGESTAEEALLTGEPRPVFKAVGSTVFAGSVNSGAGVLQVHVTRCARDSTLAHIVRAVRGAEGARRARLQRIADAAARVFVPGVLAASVGTYATWLVLIALGLSTRGYGEALGFAVAVLTIACPCALGLAVPTALLVGKGVGARHGLLIRDDEALLDAIKHPQPLVLFDKTGTLTKGVLKVNRFVLCALLDDAGSNADDCPMRHQILRDILRLEQHCSDHVIARSLIEYIGGQIREMHGDDGSGQRLSGSYPTDTSLNNVKVHPGRGIEGSVGMRHYLVGSTALLGLVPISEDIRAQLSALEQCGMLAVLVACNGRLLGYFALSDELKPDAAEAVRALTVMGCDVQMLTGDSWTAARCIADPLGIAHVYAGCSPVGKQDLVARKQLNSDGILGKCKAHNRQRRPVIFVGDGINDGPALAQADAGVALGGGASAVAHSAAAVVCLHADVMQVVHVLRLARRLRRTVVGSFVWSVAYNALALPLAAGVGARWGWRIGPTVSGLLMAASSTSVVLNALTLNWWRPHTLERKGSCATEGECLV